MGWERRRYRGNKVWIETDEAGAPVLDARGLARLRYKPDDDRTYSVRPAEIRLLDAPEGSEDLAPDRRRGRRPAAPARPEAPPPPVAVPPDDAEPGDDVMALAGREIHLWTDGAASGNPGPAGAGYVLIFREHRKEVARYLGDATNNVAELTAVRDALRDLRRRDVPVRVHTDSSYVIGVVTGAHRARANLDLVGEIRALAARFADLRFVKVDAHSGVEWNEAADALARKAIRERRSSETRV